jgi:hypothetical protein
MEIFATIGGVMTPENRVRLHKGLIQMNQLARTVYPKKKDKEATVKVMYDICTITVIAKVSANFLEKYEKQHIIKSSMNFQLLGAFLELSQILIKIMKIFFLFFLNHIFKSHCLNSILSPAH